MIRWWEGDDVSWDGVVRDYGSAARAAATEEHFVAVVDGRDVGWIQCASLADWPVERELWVAAGADPTAGSIDYLIGDPADRGRGLGPQIIDAFVRDVCFAGHPQWTQVAVAPLHANEASWRALARAGFTSLGTLTEPGGEVHLMVRGRPALPSPERPLDHRTVHTDDLPDTPTRDRSIPATAWVEAPADLLALGRDLPGPAGADVARYLRRIGPWLLWRVGPARGDHARYWAALAADLATAHTFDLHPDGTGSGRGPTTDHTRFRTWKEDLRDHPAG